MKSSQNQLDSLHFQVVFMRHPIQVVSLMPRKSKREEVLAELEQMEAEISITQLLRHPNDSEDGDSSLECMLD